MKKRLIVLVCILIFTLVLALVKDSVEFVYSNPLVKTSVFPYLSEVIKPIDKAIKASLKECQKDYPDMRLDFQNAYGSGFLIQNNIPNDLDYSVAVNLGKFKYDGTNAKEIATEIVFRMEKFQAELYSYLETVPNTGLYTTSNTVDMISQFAVQERISIRDIEQSIPYIFKNKDYVLYTKRQMNKDVTVDFPFIMKADEMLAEDMPPILLFAHNIKYSKEQKDFIRELTIGMDYSLSLENIQTGEVKNIDIVSEAFTGQRLQLMRRFFVPSTFIGEYSARFVKNLSYLNDDEKYFEYRMADFGRYVQVIRNLEYDDNRPIKLLKRYLQCAGIISPVLDEDTLNNIYSTLEKNLSDEDVSMINDYSTVMDNVAKIMGAKDLYKTALKNQDIVELLTVSGESISTLHDHKLLSDAEFAKMSEFNQNVIRTLYTIKSPEELQEKHKWFVDYRLKEIYPLEVAIAKKAIKDQDKMRTFITLFEKVYTDAGYHQVDLYWLEQGKIGVIKDDFTKNMTAEDLSKMAKENNLVDVKYVLINRKDVDNFRVRYSVWARYNPSPEQQANYNKLKNVLLKDKKNYSIKRKFIL